MKFENIIYTSIEGFNDYFIEEQGQVISTKAGRNCFKGQIKKLEPVISSKGYYQYYMINNEGKKKSPMQHQLLMRTFISNPNELPHINHIDGNKINNDLSNLEWCTALQNNQHAIDTGLRASDHCEVPIYQYDLKGKYLQTFKSIKEASTTMDCSSGNIVHNAQGKIANVKGYLYSYTREGSLPEYTGLPVTKGIEVKDLLSGETTEHTTLAAVAASTGLHRSKFLRRFKKSSTFIIEHFQITKTTF